MPAAPVAPAPSAPKPTAPATPAPLPKSSSSAPPAKPVAPIERDPKEFASDGNDELDQLDALERGIAPPPKPEKKEEPAKTEEPKPKPGEKPALKPGEKPAEPGQDTEPKGLPALRRAYEETKSKLKELEPQAQKAAALEAKLKELETAGTPELATLQERLKSAEARRDELEKEIHFVDYSKSKEFKEKFEQPYIDAWADAQADLAEFTVELADGNTRKATTDDLLRLANMTKAQARVEANKMFGDFADDVLAHRNKLVDLSRAQTKALTDARAVADERAKTIASQREQNQKQTLKLWSETNDAVAKKYPAMFSKQEGDEDGNSMLEKGLKFADKLFSPSEDNKFTSQDEAIRAHAIMRHKIANHDRLALWLKKARTEIETLKKVVADYEASEPNGGTGGAPRRGAASELDDAMAELDRLDQ